MDSIDFTTISLRASNSGALSLALGSLDFRTLGAGARYARVYALDALETRSPLSETESDLVRRCRGGDEAAWRDLVALHTRRVFGLAYRFTGRVDEAEDLTQEVFIKVYQTLGRFEAASGSFGAWLMTVARNHAIDHYRRRRQEQRRKADDPAIIEFADSGGESPLSSLERQERVQLVHRGLRALPLELREPLILCDLQGLPYEEVAGVLGIPLGTVKSRINRGRLELAKRLVGRRSAYLEGA